MALKLGCHDFINAKPLITPLEEMGGESPFQLIYGTPAILADKLKEGELDLAIIPSIEYARIPGLSLLRQFSISSLGGVKTVLLFSQKEIHDVEVVALDKSSRTSVAMLKILFAERFDIDPEFVPCEPKAQSMMAMADAGLIIGDNAFSIDGKKYVTYDLGEEWFMLTGRPFVHAVIAVREGVDLQGKEQVIGDALKRGFASMERIADREAARLKITPEICLDYLTKRIRYQFGSHEEEGLHHFFELAFKYHLIDKEQEIRFYG